MRIDTLGKKLALAGGLVIGVLILIAVVYLTVIAPSFIGKTGSDGALLKRYIDPQDLQQLTIQPDDEIWIIDVRSAKMYNQGHIPTARSFPSSEIEDRLTELPQDKYLIMYCETGGRVQVVMNKLAKHGYSRYMNWGGYTRWPYKFATDDGNL
ncbi:rhodanese-like domain-containing protein [Syntrophomonas curvata]